MKNPLPKNKLGTNFNVSLLSTICYFSSDRLVDLCKEMFPDSGIAHALQMKRTKCTDVRATKYFSCKIHDLLKGTTVIKMLDLINIYRENVGMRASSGHFFFFFYFTLLIRLRQNFLRVYHSQHLRASETAKTRPRHCEDLINIYSRFSHITKRLYRFRQFHSLLDLKPHKILHPHQTH